MRMNVRRFCYVAVAATAISLAACGGGGGGGGVSTTPATTSPTSTPTTSPTLAPASEATTAPVSASSSTSVQFGGVSNTGTNAILSSTLTLPATGVATTASLTLTATTPNGVVAPAKSHVVKRAATLGIQSTLAYLAVQFPVSVSIAQSIGFVATLPGAPSGNWYLLFEDPSGTLGTGWSDLAQFSVSGDTLTVTPAALPAAITLAANQTYYFAIASTGVNPIVTPAPSSSPSTAPSSSPSTAPSASASPTSSPTTSPTAQPTSSSGYGNATAQTCPNGATTSSGTLDCTQLPLGDQKYKTTGAQMGYVYECSAPNGTGTSTTGPWINSTNNTWDGSTDTNGKVADDGSNSFSGSFSETSDGTTRTISGNAEPISPVTAGNYPITSADQPAFQYDKNPNSIAAHTYSFKVPANPTAAATPGCESGGPIGVAMDGVMIYNAFDAQGNDAVAREIQDSCHGHPDQSDVYHYHGWLPACVTDSGSSTQNSSLLGYAADGYGIYGPWYNGKLLTSADLDECHGTTSAVMWDGQLTTIYHYVATYDFPYTVACFHGTASNINVP